jgi:hypothetical protein
MSDKVNRTISLDRDVDKWIIKNVENASAEINNYFSKQMGGKMDDEIILNLKLQELKLEIETIEKMHERNMLQKNNELTILETEIKYIIEKKQNESNKQKQIEDETRSAIEKRSKSFYQSIKECFSLEELKAINFEDYTSIRQFRNKLYKFMKEKGDDYKELYKSFSEEEIINFVKSILENEDVK